MLAKFVFGFSCLYICIFFPYSYALQYLQMYQDQSLVDKLPSYSPAWTFNLSKTECAVKCSEIRDCSVMVYNSVSLVCNLYEQTRMATATSTVMDVSGWTFYHKNQRLCPSTGGYIYSLTVDRCIRMGLVKTTHSGAVAACQNENAMLVKVDSQEMWQFVVTHIVNNNLDKTYIQGTKNADGSWRYDDNSEVTFLNWGKNQPGNSPAEICFDLWSKDAYMLHDVSGAFNYNYACEIDLK